MYNKIMVPVDLTHVDRLEKALVTAADLSRHYNIPLCFVGVTAEAPTEIAHNPQEFAEKLKAFGNELAERLGLTVDTASYPSHDPTVDLDKTLINAAKETGADLIVMASHVPGIPDHLFAAHAATVAARAEVSVFVIR